LVRPVPVVLLDERIEARLLLQDIGGGGLGRFLLQRQVHALVPAVLLGMPGFRPLDLDAQPEPPHGQFAEPVERVRGGEGHAVVGPDGVGQSKVLEGALECREGKSLLSRRQRVARQEERLAKSVIVRG